MTSIANPVQLILKATQFAAHKHKDQRRKDANASPYINHPIALANVLSEEGDVADASVIAAALLHDTIEDTETSYEEIRGQFGDEIAEIVAEVTDTKWLEKKSRARVVGKSIHETASNSQQAAATRALAFRRHILRAAPIDLLFHHPHQLLVRRFDQVEPRAAQMPYRFPDVNRDRDEHTTIARLELRRAHLQVNVIVVERLAMEVKLVAVSKGALVDMNHARRAGRVVDLAAGYILRTHPAIPLLTLLEDLP